MACVHRVEQLPAVANNLLQFVARDRVARGQEGFDGTHQLAEGAVERAVVGKAAPHFRRQPDRLRFGRQRQHRGAEFLIQARGGVRADKQTCQAPRVFAGQQVDPCHGSLPAQHHTGERRRLAPEVRLRQHKRQAALPELAHEAGAARDAADAGELLQVEVFGEPAQDVAHRAAAVRVAFSHLQQEAHPGVSACDGRVGHFGAEILLDPAQRGAGPLDALDIAAGADRRRDQLIELGRLGRYISLAPQKGPAHGALLGFREADHARGRLGLGPTGILVERDVTVGQRFTGHLQACKVEQRAVHQV